MAKKKAKKQVQVKSQDFECEVKEKNLICEPKKNQNAVLHPKYQKFEGTKQ